MRIETNIQRLFVNCIDTIRHGDYHLPLRLTEHQRKLLSDNPQWKARSLCTSGVCLDFVTDSRRLRLTYRTHSRVRDWLAFDIFLNNQMWASRIERPPFEDTGTLELTLDHPGEKNNRVTIYLPHTSGSEIASLGLDENASVRRAEEGKGKLLCLGDSITQGMDSLHPASTFPVQISRFMDLQLLNQGIGGHIFDAGILDGELTYDPDLVFIAYGTNDWAYHESMPSMQDAAENFLRRASELFPRARIFVITPIWRRDMRDTRPLGSFADLRRTIIDICSRLPSLHVIDGLDLVPHIPSYFGDERVHPTDEGFLHYSINLLRKILPHLS